MTEASKNTRRVRFEFSAGGVVMGPEGVLLIRIKDLTSRVLWTFPKGKIEERESSREAALREVREETGCRCGIIRPLGSTRYLYRDRENLTVIKKVRWYLMHPLDTKPDPEPGVISSEWKSLSEARSLLEYSSDSLLLEKAVSSQ